MEICVGCRGGGCAELEQQEEQDGQDSEQELNREAPPVYAIAEKLEKHDEARKNWGQGRFSGEQKKKELERDEI